MIRTTIAQAAVNLAEELAQRNITIGPVGSSDLAALNGCVAVASVPNAEASMVDIMTGLSMMVSETMQESEHNLELDRRIHALSTLAGAHISFAKNVAGPAIKDLGTRLKAAMDATPKSVTYNPVITAYYLPEPMRGGAMDSLLESDAGSAGKFDLDTATTMLQKSGDEVIVMLMTGVKVADAAISLWAQRKTPEFFRSLWNTAFCDGPRGNDIASLLEDKLEGADYSMAFYLLGRNLKGNPPQGTSISLSEFNRDMASICAAAAQRLVVLTKYMRADMRDGRVIVSCFKNNVVVNGQIYDQWIDEQGGNPALICANALQDRPYKTIAEITANGVALIENWERHNRILTSAEANRRELRLGEMIRNAGCGVVQDYATQLFEGSIPGEVIGNDSPSVLRAYDVIEAFINEHSANGVLATGNVWHLATDLIAGHILKDTAAYPILKGIDLLIEKDSSIPVEEAALIASIDYLVDYVYGQMTVLEA
jgi:hypothetical protein